MRCTSPKPYSARSPVVIQDGGEVLCLVHPGGVVFHVPHLRAAGGTFPPGRVGGGPADRADIFIPAEQVRPPDPARRSHAITSSLRIPHFTMADAAAQEGRRGHAPTRRKKRGKRERLDLSNIAMCGKLNRCNYPPWGDVDQIQLAVSDAAGSRGGRIGNRVQITDGTAAVSTDGRSRRKPVIGETREGGSARQELFSGTC